MKKTGKPALFRPVVSELTTGNVCRELKAGG